MTSDAEVASTVDQATHPLVVMQRVTDRTLELVGPARGVMVGVLVAHTITYVAGSGNQTSLLGTQVEVDSSLSGVAVTTGAIQRSDDTELDDRVDREKCRLHSVRSLMCVPLRRGGETLGVMAVNSPEAHAFGPEHVRTLEQVAAFIATAIGSARDLHEVTAQLLELDAAGPPGRTSRPDDDPASAPAQRYVVGVLDPGGADRLAVRQRVHRYLGDGDDLSMVLQPVIELATDATVAVEALARFGTEPERPPDRWFADAHRCGLGWELEVLAVRRAMAMLPLLDDRLALTFNVGPEVAQSATFLDALEGVDAARVILELTEHSAIDDYPTLVAALRTLRRRGMRIAIDDTGSGYSSLAHILRIAPDFIKLDCELTAGIDLDPVRRALAAALVAFAADTGARIVAEGVETAAELEVLRDLGVPFAQGFHLARPMPIHDLAAQLDVHPLRPLQR